MTGKATEMEKRRPEPGEPAAELPVVGPAVDIVERRDAFALAANMPGVDETSLNVAVDEDILTIEGTARIEPPAGCRLIAQEFAAGRFTRSFELSNRVAAGAIEGRIRDGVLQVTLPKRDEVRTRKIQVTAG